MLTQQPPTAHELQILNDLPTVWIKTDEQLERLLDELDTLDIIALDTEFIKRDTFFPRLALLQINTGTVIYLLDAPKLDLYDFWQVIGDIPTMVLHACGEDLGIYYLLSELPALTNVFDTQIGLGFLTGELSLGYQTALLNTLDIHVNKGESQSDWLKRPLTFEQEQYASDDVRYLLALYNALKQQLNQQNLWQYAKQDCQDYSTELYNLSQITDDQLYLNVANFNYNREQLAILQALCEWREQLARSINRPRTYILRPKALQELVEKPPFGIKQLGYHDIKPQVIRMYGNEILNIIHQVQKTDCKTYPELIPIPYRKLPSNIQEALQDLINAHAKALNIPENILMRKKWLGDLYAHAIDNKRALPLALLGWRHDWIIGSLLPTLQNMIQPHSMINNQPVVATDTNDEN
ncbi:3'-5' exonuclease [Moraxella macacae 0408225]|uniref:3'-5' exonuclease n=1 Tax=Moraxella macacae 0408225 TaxID=1230338 RepID=L2F6A0_9GAMM|nr:HRDC domain-containing protein [Moraxella macacae]ELA07983.1 3'-5' exonuclease [Moraxella macacae 0408225]